MTSELDIEQEVWRYKYLCAYVDDSFKFINSFIVVPQLLMIVLMMAPSQNQVGTQSVLNIENLDKLIVFCTEARSFGEMLAFMGLTDRTKFRRKYIHPLLEAGLLEQTMPEKPNSRNQKYQLTDKGFNLLDSQEHKN